MTDRHLTSDQLKDAVFSLRMVKEWLTRVCEDAVYWKWVFIALHNSLQGFMVTCLCPFNDFAVMQPAPKKKKCCNREEDLCVGERNWGTREEWEVYRGDPQPLPKPPRMLNFMDLYKLVKKREYMESSSANPFKPNGTQTHSLKLLNFGLRNEFVHFMPKMLCNPVAGFPRITRDIITIIEFLAFESEAVRWSTTSAEQLCTETKALIKEILGNLDNLEEYYRSAPQKNPVAYPEWWETLMRNVALIDE